MSRRTNIAAPAVYAAPCSWDRLSVASAGWQAMSFLALRPLKYWMIRIAVAATGTERIIPHNPATWAPSTSSKSTAAGWTFI